VNDLEKMDRSDVDRPAMPILGARGADRLSEHPLASHRQSVLDEIGDRALAADNLSDFLTSSLALMGEVLDSGLVGILELTPDRQAARLRAAFGLSVADRDDEIPIAQIDPILCSDNPVVFDDCLGVPCFLRCAAVSRPGSRGGLAARIPGRTDPYGVLMVFLAAPRDVTPDNIAFVQSVARLLALAIGRLCAESERARFAALAADCNERAEGEREVRILTERKARSDAERLAIERVSVLGQVADGVIMTDSDGEPTFANDAARRILGVEHVVAPMIVEGPTTCDGYRLLTLDGESMPPERFPLRHAIRTGETLIDTAIRVRRPNGTDIIVQGNATPIVADDGSPLGAVFIFRDVTAPREFEQRKSEFTAMVSHELRTPLTVIKGQAQYVARHLDQLPAESAEPIRSRLEKIDQTASTMTALINELIDITRGHLGPLAPLASDTIPERRRPGDRTALGSVAQALVREMEPKQVAEVIVNQARHYLGGCAGLWLADHQNQSLSLLAIEAEHPITAATLSRLQSIPFNAPTFCAHVFRTERPVEVRDVVALGPSLAYGRQSLILEGFRSAYSQPLVAQGRVVGVMTIVYAAPHTFSPEERDLIGALGDLGAVAIDHAQLYRAEKEATQRVIQSAALLNAR
jgi:GAF domain-containing protein